jgi:hypothetical protein
MRSLKDMWPWQKDNICSRFLNHYDIWHEEISASSTFYVYILGGMITP